MKRFYFFPILICSAQLVLAQGRVGINTSSPQAMLHVRDSSVLFSGDTTSNPGNPPASGPGARMMWYADKAAFRAGRVSSTEWDKDNVGYFSIALGEGSLASGNYSVALGRRANATAGEAIAIGEFTNATGSNSTAIGYNTRASMFGAIALGEGTAASGIASTAMGDKTQARGLASTAMGFRSVAAVSYSTAMGLSTRASAEASVAMGIATTAKSYASLAIGRFNDTTSDGLPNTWVLNDPLFTVGNGLSDDQRNNAFVIKKNGNTTINGNTKIALDTEIGGSLTIAGNNNIGGDATIAGTASISNNTSIGGNATIAGTASISNNTNIGGSLTITGNNKTGGNATISGTAFIGNSTSITGNLTITNEVRRSTTGLANLVPVCYGSIATGGTISSGTGNFSVINSATGVFEITITSEAYNNTGYITTLSVIAGGTFRVATTGAQSGKLVVRIFDVNGSLTNTASGFSFVVYKP